MKFIIALLPFFYSTAFAAIPPANCNINGDWYQEGLPWLQFHFVQSGSILLGTTPYPQCGDIVAKGTVMQNVANFNVTANSKEGYCDYIAYVKAIFINSCSKMIWEVTQNGKTDTVKFIRISVKIVEPKQEDLIISSEPRMPTFVARIEPEDPTMLKTRRGDIPAYTWGINIKHVLGADLYINAKIDDFKTDSEIYRPNFNTLKDIKSDGTISNLEGGVVGGELTLSIDYYENLHVEKKYPILKGTNPGQVAIEQILTDRTLRQLACQESRYKQFNAHREGGIGKLNTKDGSRGGVGIMQLYEPMPTTAATWNWRENLKEGMELYKKKMAVANKLPKKELKDLNKERISKGLAACTNPLPPLNPEQLERETIRLYNCGHEYRWEPRDAPNCAGRWVQSLSCQREGKTGYDPKYVDNVLKCDVNH